MIAPEVLEDFWSQVAKSDGCWLWSGAAGNGYGYFGGVPGEKAAHRASYVIEHGPIPPGAFICHTCDGGRIGCVRPSHLYAGDARTNARDMSDRNRFNARSGELHPSKFHSHPVQRTETGLKAAAYWLAVREELGLTQFQMALALGVTTSTISRIERGVSTAQLSQWQRLAKLTGRPVLTEFAALG